MATQNAQFAGAEGEQQTAAEGAKTKAAVGATLANEGASGIDVDSGSNVDVRESEAKIGMLNALTIRSNAAKSLLRRQSDDPDNPSRNRVTLRDDRPS